MHYHKTNQIAVTKAARIYQLLFIKMIRKIQTLSHRDKLRTGMKHLGIQKLHLYIRRNLRLQRLIGFTRLLINIELYD
jgi:hypothetical protein